MINLDSINMIQTDKDKTNCYVIRGEKGDILIDTGREEYRDHIETWLLNYDIKLIILTHGHAGCVQNAGYFSKLYGAPVMISPYDMRLARDNDSRPYYETSPLARLYRKQTELDRHTRMNPFDPKIYAEEGMELSEYGVDGVILSLEGHTKGSIGVLCKSKWGYDLYAGDAVTGGSLQMFPVICESPKMAKESAERIVTLAPDRILCGRGDPIAFGSKPHKRFIGRFG